MIKFCALSDISEEIPLGDRWDGGVMILRGEEGLKEKVPLKPFP